MVLERMELAIPLKAEEDQENLYLEILSHIPTSILIIDRYLRVNFANNNFLVKMRREKEEILGKKVSEIFPLPILSHTNLEGYLRKVFQTGSAFEGREMRYRAPGLEYRTYFYTIIPLKDRGKEIHDVMLVMDDITEKKRLGERIQQIEKHLASVVESATDLIISLDSKGYIMSWNNAAEKTLGLSSYQMIGQPFNNLFLERDRSSLKNIFGKMAAGGSIQETELNMTAKEVKELLISWRFSAMRNDEGEMVAIVGVGRDLTEKRKLELQLIQSTKMAALGEMAGGIAHEIRNPLAIISSSAQILTKLTDYPDIRKECCSKIQAATERAAIIIENLLRFARPSEGLVEPVDINSIIEDTLSLVEHQISLQGIEIQKEFQSQLSSVIGNKNQLQQVFMNITLNAYYAMPNGGKFTIKTRAESSINNPSWLEISFSDTGKGISEENLSRVFDPFFTTMSVGQGTGLGLSIAYSIIRHHNGSIKVKSKLGEGSTFIITLPPFNLGGV